MAGDGVVKIDREKVFQLWQQGLCCKEIAEQLNSSGATVSEILKENYGITRKQIYERVAKKNRERNGEKVKQYSLDGQFIRTYRSIKEAKEITGASKLEWFVMGKEPSLEDISGNLLKNREASFFWIILALGI